MFKDGTPSGGRPKGRQNDSTIRVRQFCQKVWALPEYQQTVIDRACNGTLGSMEPVIWHYAFGKPKEQLNVTFNDEQDDLSTLTVEELEERMTAMLGELKTAQEAKRAIAEAIDVQPIAVEEVPDGRDR